MTSALKAELRKLLTVRSTYIITTISFLFTGFLSLYVFGLRAETGPGNSFFMTNVLLSVIGASSIFIALVSALLMAHEYRYNTIMYTFTNARSRTFVALAKLVVVLGYAVFMTLASMLLAVVLVRIGLGIKDHPLGPQELDLWNVLWRTLVSSMGWASAGLIITMLVRHMVGSLAVIFIVPSTMEGLLGLVLKQNVIYLPFAALSQLTSGQPQLAPPKAALVFGLYAVAGWVIAWVLLLRRDAN